MREIKFRGLTAKGALVYGYLVQDKKDSTAYWDEYSQRICWFPESGGYANAPVENGTVGQYTGLKDVDGVEIYEGDILLNCYDHFGEEKSYIAGVVKWSEFEVDVQGAVCSTPLIGFNIDGVALATDEKYKVIGNIYENPELLGETK